MLKLEDETLTWQVRSAMGELMTGAENLKGVAQMLDGYCELSSTPKPMSSGKWRRAFGLPPFTLFSQHRQRLACRSVSPPLRRSATASLTTPTTSLRRLHQARPDTRRCVPGVVCDV